VRFEKKIFLRNNAIANYSADVVVVNSKVVGLVPGEATTKRNKRR
jgi:hypothetical protein